MTNQENHVNELKLIMRTLGHTMLTLKGLGEASTSDADKIGIGEDDLFKGYSRGEASAYRSSVRAIDKVKALVEDLIIDSKESNQ